MAVFNCVEQLEEDILDESIVPQIAAGMQDLCVEIMVRCIVHNDVSVVELFNDTMQGNHARVG
jgi:hypothetical protein